MEKLTITSVGTAAAVFSRAEALGAEALEFVAGVLGSSPTFSEWEAVRKDFVAGYAAERKCDADSAGKAWTRFAERMKSAYAVEKPKAPTKAAERKSAERVKAAEAVKAIVEANGGSVAKIKAAIPKDAPPAVVKQFADAMLVADKATQSKAKDAAKEARDALRKRIGEMTAEQITALAKAADMICAGKKPTWK